MLSQKIQQWHVLSSILKGQREDQKNVINPSGTQEEIDMF